MSVGELPLEAEEFLVWMSAERGRARNTVQAYRRDLLQYHEWLHQRSLSPLTVGHHDLVDFVTYFQAGTQWARRPGTALGPAAACGFAVAMVTNFAWNRRWTFASDDRALASQAARFFAVSVGGGAGGALQVQIQEGDSSNKIAVVPLGGILRQVGLEEIAALRCPTPHPHAGHAVRHT